MTPSIVFVTTSPSDAHTLLPDWAFVGVLVTAAATALASRTLHWLQTRRDVYLEFGAAFQAAGLAMAHIANPQVGIDVALETFTGSSKILAKAPLLAKPSLLKAVSDFQHYVAKSFVELIGERNKLTPFQSEIAAWTPIRDQHQRQLDQTLEEQRRYNVDQVREPPRWNVLQSNFEFHSREIDTINARLDAAHKSVLLFSLKAGRIALEKQRLMIPLAAEVIRAARRELGLGWWTFHKENYVDQATQGLAEAIAKVEENLREIEEQADLQPAASASIAARGD